MLQYLDDNVRPAILFIPAVMDYLHSEWLDNTNILLVYLCLLQQYIKKMFILDKP